MVFMLQVEYLHKEKNSIWSQVMLGVWHDKKTADLLIISEKNDESLENCANTFKWFIYNFCMHYGFLMTGHILLSS